MLERIVANREPNIHELHSTPSMEKAVDIFVSTTINKDTYETENVMASVELFWELIKWIIKVLEAIFPKAHVLEATE